MLLTQTSEGGQRVPPLTSLIEAFTYFFTRPTPTCTSYDNKISQKVHVKEKHVLEKDTLLY